MKPLFPFAAALLLLFTAVGCSKDDAPNDPEGTVSLNMFNSDNGHTWLGNMGVYIDSSDNFVCRNCSMAEAGPSGGISSIDRLLLNNLAKQMAVREGYGYAVYRDEDVLRFPSGKTALLADAVYYRMRVETRLTDSETGESVGAHVKYMADRAERHSLPMPGEYVYDMRSAYSYWVTDLPLGKIDEMFIDDPLVILEVGDSDGGAVLVSRTDGADSNICRLYMRQNDVWSYVLIYI